MNPNQMNPNQMQQNYMNTPDQPSPYTQPSPYNQQHSVGSFNIPPGSNPSIQPHTPQQQLNIPQQRSIDGRFTSPQSIAQRSPATNVLSNQPVPQLQSVNQPTPGAPQSTRQPSQQIASQPFPTDPLQANHLLVVKELRRALCEVSQHAVLLLSSKFSTEYRGPLSTPNLQPLSVGPSSANPGSNNTQTKEQRSQLTEEEIQSTRERYIASVQQFLAITDNIERNFATIIEANREIREYDSLSAVKVPNDLMAHPYVELIQPSLEVITDDCNLVEKTIKDMNDLVKKVKDAEEDNAMDTL